MASRVQKIMFWDTFKNAKSVILHYFPVAEIGSNIHLLYFSYPQEIWAQFVEWGKKVLSPYRPQWSVYFSVLLLPIAGKLPVLEAPSRKLCLEQRICDTQPELYHRRVGWGAGGSKSPYHFPIIAILGPKCQCKAVTKSTEMGKEAGTPWHSSKDTPMAGTQPPIIVLYR